MAEWETNWVVVYRSLRKLLAGNWTHEKHVEVFKEAQQRQQRSG
jgi:hypothetical protein